MKFINPLFLLFSSIPKLIISTVSYISNPLELNYFVWLFTIFISSIWIRHF